MERPLVVMTGGTSGIGVHAATYLSTRFDRILLGRRGQNAIAVGEAIPLDLSSLESVKRFCNEVISACDDREIDILILNAGGNFPHVKTLDGFESNFAVNHLAHYLIVRSLMPYLAVGASVVITTSGTHDPAENTAVPPPKHADATRLAYPDKDPELDESKSTAASRAYSASKLANLLTAQALVRTQQIRDRAIKVIAYSPGPTPGTGLVSARGPALGFFFRHILPIMVRFSSKMNSPEAAGQALAKLALGELQAPSGKVYALLRDGKVVFPDPSELARNEKAIAAMWADSAKLLDIQSEAGEAGFAE